MLLGSDVSWAIGFQVPEGKSWGEGSGDQIRWQMDFWFWCDCWDHWREIPKPFSLSSPWSCLCVIALITFSFHLMHTQIVYIAICISYFPVRFINSECVISFILAFLEANYSKVDSGPKYTICILNIHNLYIECSQLNVHNLHTEWSQFELWMITIWIVNLQGDPGQWYNYCNSLQPGCSLCSND